MSIQRAEEETLQRTVFLAQAVAKTSQRGQAAHGVGALWRDRLQRRLGSRDQVVHLKRQQSPLNLEHDSPPWLVLEADMFAQYLLVQPPVQRHVVEHGHVQQPRPQAVVDVVGVVGHAIGQIDDLGFKTGLSGVEESSSDTAGLGRLESRCMVPTAMLEDALARLERQVQAVEVGVALFQVVHDPKALQVVFEATMVAHAQLQGVLSGMAERCVAEVVGQGHRLDQVLAEPQASRDGPAQLGHLQRMGQPGPEQVAFMVQEHLCLVDQAPKGGAVDDPVTVSLMRAPVRGLCFRVSAAARVQGVARPGREHRKIRPLEHCGAR